MTSSSNRRTKRSTSSTRELHSELSAAIYACLLMVTGCAPVDAPERSASDTDGAGQVRVATAPVDSGTASGDEAASPSAGEPERGVVAEGSGSGNAGAAAAGRNATDSRQQTVTTNEGGPRRPDFRAMVGEPEPPSRPRLAVRAGNHLALSFDDLEFPIEPGQEFQQEMITEKISGYDGQKVSISGFILPASVFEQTGIKEFVLVRDNQQCCFGPGAYVYHNIQVQMAPGHTADFTVRAVKVEGTFRIKPWYGPDKKCYSVYHLTGTSVK